MKEKNIFISTPIYYVNANPHIGHAYTTITADLLKRFWQMQNNNVFFLTGTDEHGDKIAIAATQNNLSPKEYADKISQKFRNLLPVLNVSNDYFIRTTDESHKKVVETILKNIYDKDDIYFSEYEGLYCFACERFYQERELKDNKCPDHNSELSSIKESNYFFKLSKYQDWLIEHIKQNEDFIRPKFYRNEILSFLEEPLEDLCISRPKSRLTWGIGLPFDENYVTYVWFDALINYISALSYPGGELFKNFWSNSNHVVAKDIIKPHAIYWPIMLKAAGLPIYKSLNIHGFWNVDNMKMSKTIGNVVDPFAFVEKYTSDAFRFFLMKQMAFGQDSSFSEKALIETINSDLANNLGNLVSRVLAMHKKYVKNFKQKNIDDIAELSLKEDALKTIDIFYENMEKLKFHLAISDILNFVDIMNKYIDNHSPWALAKDEKDEDRLKCVLYNVLEGLKIVAGLLYPIMPKASEKMRKILKVEEEKYYIIENLRNWNLSKEFSDFDKAPIFFPRIQ